MRIKNNNIELRTIHLADLKALWRISYCDHLEWMKYDGPYFNDPVYEESDFINNIGPKHYVNQQTRLAIIIKNEIVGVLNAHFEDGVLRKWLEIGIAIYDDKKWNQGIGYQAIQLFTTYLFDMFPNIRRIGFTTWSGNYGMMKLGEKLGFTKEAQIRQVRFWQDQYWDSVKYGVLRE